MVSPKRCYTFIQTGLSRSKARSFPKSSLRYQSSNVAVQKQRASDYSVSNRLTLATKKMFQVWYQVFHGKGKFIELLILLINFIPLLRALNMIQKKKHGTWSLGSSPALPLTSHVTWGKFNFLICKMGIHYLI